MQDVLSLADRFGYRWDEAEAREFLAYNIDKGRKGGWSFAVQKWEKNRSERSRQHSQNAAVSQQELDEMADYLSVVNRFREED